MATLMRQVSRWDSSRCDVSKPLTVMALIALLAISCSSQESDQIQTSTHPSDEVTSATALVHPPPTSGSSGAQSTPAPPQPVTITSTSLTAAERATVDAAPDYALTFSFSPALADRYTSNTTSPGDLVIVRAILEGTIHSIGGLYFDRAGSIEESNDIPEDAPAYVLLDEITGGMRMVAWFDDQSGDVVELSTGYLLNVRKPPGTGLEAGPNGEKLFVYGFAWFPRWERLLPEPIISLAERFYTNGVDHVRSRLGSYQTVAEPSYTGGDLTLISWDEGLPERMEVWLPEISGPPLAYLPDSGTVDVRDERFRQIFVDERLQIDDRSIERYLTSGVPANSRYDRFQTEQEVKDILSFPFENPHMYSDFHKMLILDAVYGSEGRLRIVIDSGIDGGFKVRDSGEKVMRIAPSELDLNFGYPGLLVAVLPHEMGHVIDARDRPFIDAPCWENEDNMKETLKYMMQFMWWVELYPNDAPYWDWEPINSGLTLARILEGHFPNSSC